MSQAAVQHYAHAEPEYHTDIPVGEILRRTRVHYNQSVMEVEAALRIRGSQLQAIEEGNFNAMPGRVYAIGFVRAYSEYLGLDGDKMVELFKNQYAAFRNRPTLNFPVTMAESKMPSPYIILGSLAGGILVIAFWSMFMLPKHQREVIPPVPEALTQTTLPVINVTEAISDEVPDTPEEIVLEEPIEEVTSVTPSIPQDRVELVVSENSWTDIRNADGSIILRQILKPGDKYTVPEGAAGEGLILSTGNAGGITVFIGGKRLGVLGEAAQVKRNISLNVDDIQSFLEKL